MKDSLLTGVLVCMIFASLASAQGAPILPMIVSGEVFVDGAEAPEGTVVKALVDGVERSSYTLTEPGEQYILKISGASEDTGKELSFTVDGVEVTNIKLAWTSGDVASRSISISTPNVVEPQGTSPRPRNNPAPETTVRTRDGGADEPQELEPTVVAAETTVDAENNVGAGDPETTLVVSPGVVSPPATTIEATGSSSSNPVSPSPAAGEGGIPSSETTGSGSLLSAGFLVLLLIVGVAYLSSRKAKTKEAN